MSWPPAPTLLAFLGQLGVPALVAVIVTFLLNKRLERSRGRREINTRAFELARDNVRRFAELTASYWVRVGQESDVEVETQIVLTQEDVLVDVAEALDLALDADRSEIETALDELVRFGTGGNFQGADRQADLGRARIIPGAAARLRRALLRARRSLLENRGH